MKSTILLTIPLLSLALSPRGSCNEGLQKLCYGVNGGVSQDVDPGDVQFAADYLRHAGKTSTGADKFWTMPKNFDCPEWTMPVEGGSLLVVAKHNTARYASSILYEDFADAIDGGENAGEGEREKALGGCGRHGGQIGVVADTGNKLYKTDEYRKTGARPEGIVMKIVKAPK